MRNLSTSGKGRRSKEDGIQESKGGENDLSGAYLRKLVKQLGSSLPKDEATTPARKQTRRRVHTSKPYKTTITNMAEARREIVTALKFHRASMKRASEQLQISNPPLPPPPSPSFENPIFPWPSSGPLGLNLNLEGFNYPSLFEDSSSERMSNSAPSKELHQSMDEEEMARIISIGKQHDVEWNDNLNSVTSAWWSEFLKVVEESDDSEGKEENFISFSKDSQ